MEEIEILKRAQLYIEQMANGYNPLTGEEIDETDFINNVRISRCLFYVNDKLKELIKCGGSVKPLKNRKTAFIYDQAKIDLVAIEDRNLSLSEIIRNVIKAYGEDCKLTYAMVAPLLQDKGLLINNPGEGPKLVASPEGAKYGIWSEIAHGQRGDYLRTFYDPNGQKFVLNLLKELSN